MSATIPPEVLEATLILAPVRSRQALMSTIAATRMFLLMYGREPSEDAVRDRFLKEALGIDCSDTDIQWLVDAGLVDSDILADWRKVSREHA